MTGSTFPLAYDSLNVVDFLAYLLAYDWVYISNFCFIFSAGRYQGSGGSWGTATALTTDPTGLM